MKREVESHQLNILTNSYRLMLCWKTFNKHVFFLVRYEFCMGKVVLNFKCENYNERRDASQKKLVWDSMNITGNGF